MCQTEGGGIILYNGIPEKELNVLFKRFPFLCFTGLDRKLFLNKDEGD